MIITIDRVKSAILKKGYKWFVDQPNLVGIRTSTIKPDQFNDIFVMIWTQQAMPSGLNSLQKQVWLNANLFYGANNKQLVEDGNFGTNSQFALSQYEKSLGKERIMTWPCTTIPGVYWLNNPINKSGCAVLKPNQWVNCWSIGFHKGKADHQALVQVGPVSVYRDADRDNIAEEQTRVETGLFGINIHRGNLNGVTPKVGQWSAGCTVFQKRSDHTEMISICKLYKTYLKNKYTYTVIKEYDL